MEMIVTVNLLLIMHAVPVKMIKNLLTNIGSKSYDGQKHQPWLPISLDCFVHSFCDSSVDAPT